MKILITIIIATYNAEKFVKSCLESIIPQKTNIIELIIIDGASKDNTNRVIHENEQHISYWITEPDNGIYDAWNKGIANARGEWIMFIGADDILCDDAIENYIKHIKTNSITNKNTDFISSIAQILDINNKPIKLSGREYKWPLFLKEMTVSHPGALHSKELFNHYGIYNTSYKIVGDYELLLRAGSQLKASYLNKTTVLMREGGVSFSTKAIMEHYKAATQTGNYPNYKALINAGIVYIKFKTKCWARKLGVNLYLRKI